MSARRIGLSLLLLLFAACGGDAAGGGGDGKVAVPGQPGAVKTSAVVRAGRRLFDGAPPVIPHQDFGAACLSCHQQGRAVDGVGYAPPVPHAGLEGGVDEPSAMSRCRMCHVFGTTTETFVDNDFVGLAQDLRHGKRLNELAPPVIPHQTLLRENCKACHDGPAAREEIRCPHPERDRCAQCHVPQRVETEFVR